MIMWIFSWYKWFILLLLFHKTLFWCTYFMTIEEKGNPLLSNVNMRKNWRPLSVIAISSHISSQECKFNNVSPWICVNLTILCKLLGVYLEAIDNLLWWDNQNRKLNTLQMFYFSPLHFSTALILLCTTMFQLHRWSLHHLRKRESTCPLMQEGIYV